MAKAKNSPPKLFLNFFRWYCHPRMLDYVEGDLMEVYGRRVKESGKRKADWKFILDVLLLFRPGIIRPRRPYQNLNTYSMYKSYFKIAYRVIIRNKMYSAIHVFGLTIGVTFALLISVFIYGEVQVNQDLKDVDQLYLLESRYRAGHENFEWYSPAPLVEQAVEKYPTLFDEYYRFYDRNITISKEDKHFRVQSMIGDTSFLPLFGFTVLHGDAQTALTAPNSIVITEKIASLYFGKADVEGETLLVSTEQNGLKEFQITAVIADLQKKNSVSDFMMMDAQVFLSFENIRDFFNQVDIDNWSTDIISYLKLTKGASRQEAHSAIHTLLKDHAPLVAERRSIELNPLQDFYLKANSGSVQKLVVSLAIVAFFILLLAIVNFVNISIASSISRLREVGVRKALGGMKQQVVIQFLCESTILSVISGIGALLFYQLSHGYFGDVLGSPLLSLANFPLFLWGMISAGVLLIGILAGLYPSFYLSLTKPIESLKGKLESVKGTIRFSRSLIVIQFAVTIFIFISAVVLSQQISFFLEKDLGYNKSRVLVVDSVPRIFSEEGFQKMESAKQEFLRSYRVQSASLSWGAPGFGLSPVDAKIYPLGKSPDEGIRTAISSVDGDYLNVFEIEMIDGRFLSANEAARIPNTIVINKAAQKAMSLHVGDKVGIQNFGDVEYTVTGIVDDFNFESLHTSVKPVAFMHNRDFGAFRYFSFKLENGDLLESVQELEKLWKQVFPNDPFSYAFADERLQMLYTTELQLKKGSSMATVLMLILVLTGVFGLVSLSVSKRSKEIGVRKVLGASVFNILALISREYVLLMILAVSLGAPLAYWFASSWLENFAFHITLSWWMIALPFGIVFLMTLVIVVSHSLRTAMSNPVNSLKSE
ncbi:putative ABC transport system permease protein [Algoriphagus sp. 4150]|uniref:ABC transporter permease n=1 Tax=Algoriphagus sp. 4150 TaxID=2817756 RepID=UPI002854D769|nr:ABC transporter permease [Algoriphagus sp. 4150]MDR7130398.1 putative ABC transport system permease protein [Algoriphagus sp. 4150]